MKVGGTYVSQPLDLQKFNSSSVELVPDFCRQVDMRCSMPFNVMPKLYAIVFIILFIDSKNITSH